MEQVRKKIVICPDTDPEKVVQFIHLASKGRAAVVFMNQLDAPMGCSIPVFSVTCRIYNAFMRQKYSIARFECSSTTTSTLQTQRAVKGLMAP